MIIVELIYNLTLLVALSVVSGFIDQHWKRDTQIGSIYQGLLFGAVAIFGMLQPFHFGPGLILDGRSVVISLCALFFGPYPAAIAALMAIIFRIGLGGAGVIMGVSVIIASAVIGLIFYYKRIRFQRRVSALYLLFLGFVVHLTMLLLTFTLPYDTAISILESTGPAIIIFYPLATVLAGKILYDQELSKISLEKLKESEARWQFALEEAGDGVWDWNVQTNEVIYSPRWKALLGYEAHEIENTFEQWSKLIHPDDRKQCLDDLQMYLKDSESIYKNEHRLRCKDGAYKWILDRGKVMERASDGKPLRMIGTHTDIDERKINEQIIRDRQKQLLAIADNMSGPAARVDCDLCYTFASKWYENTYSLPFEKIIGRKMIEVMGEINFTKIKPYIEQVLKGKRIVFDVELELHSGNRWYEVIYTPDFADDGAILGFFVIGSDTTDRRWMQEALKESETRYRNLFENNHAVMLLIDPEDGSIADANPMAERFYGWDKKQLLQMKISDINTLSPEEVKTEMENARLFKKNYFEFRHRLANGNCRDVEVYSGVVKIKNRDYLYSIVHDVTEKKKAEFALRESERRLSTLISNLHGIVYRCKNDPDLTMEFISDGCVSITGYSQDALLNSKVIAFADLIHPDDRQMVWDEVQKALLKNTYFKMTYRIRNANRDERWVWEQGRGIFADDGEVIALEGFITDITENKLAEEKLQESEELNKAIITCSPIALYSIDIDGNVMTWNTSAERIFGWAAQEVIGKPLPIVPKDKQDEFAGLRKRLMEGKGFMDMHLIRQKKDGTFFDASLSTAPLYDAGGNMIGILGALEDITERNRMEEDIRELNTELEQRVIERTVQLEAANKELEAFAYSVSHDLRAPLRAIDGFSRIMLEDYSAELDSEAQRLLQVIRTNTQRMDQLIADLLSLSMVTRIEMKPGRVGMAMLANSVFHEIADDETKQKFSFSVVSVPDAHADAVLMRQVWQNLISNAIKYSMKSKSQKIEVGGRTEGKNNVYYVKDFGAGFDPRYKHKLFQVFQRLHATEEFEGTGVGLAVVQRIVHRHGGTVWAEGAVGKGATFYFSVPLKI